MAEPATDLVEFLRARLDEDERVALAAAQKSDRAWRYIVIPGEPAGQSLDLSDERVLIVDWTDEDELLPPEAEHIARHDPARVLREVEAKRKLMEVHRPVQRPSTGSGGGTATDCAMCDHFPAQYPCLTLRLLALPYADHPSYLEEWRP